MDFNSRIPNPRKSETMQVLEVNGREIGRIIGYYDSVTGAYVGSAFMSARRVRRGDCINLGIRFN